jgi:hypothetical protein
MLPNPNPSLRTTSQLRVASTARGLSRATRVPFFGRRSPKKLFNHGETTYMRGLAYNPRKVVSPFERMTWLIALLIMRF